LLPHVLIIMNFLNQKSQKIHNTLKKIKNLNQNYYDMFLKYYPLIYYFKLNLPLTQIYSTDMALMFLKNPVHYVGSKKFTYEEVNKFLKINNITIIIMLIWFVE
jgi:hypothetical protein